MSEHSSDAPVTQDQARDHELEQALFVHEHDLIGNLRRFPLIARYRLDTLQLKLQLDLWQALGYRSRRTFCVAPFSNAAEQAAVRAVLQQALSDMGHVTLEPQEPEPIADFRDTTRVPESIQAALARFKLSIEPGQWAALSELARFGLAKLSRKGHENRRLGPLIDDLLYRDSSEHPDRA